MEIDEDELERELLEDFYEDSKALQADPLKRWQHFISSEMVGFYLFESCQKVWTELFTGWPPQQGPAPCWVPEESSISESNVGQWMSELGCENVSALHQWSIENRESVWEQAIDELDIAFREEPAAIFENTAGPHQPQLLPGAQMNIVESCFQTSDDQIAVITGQPDSDLQYRSYGELRAATNRVSNALIELGLQQGDRVGVIMPITFESIAIYLGIIQAGLVAVSIADSFAAPEIQNRLKIADAQAVFAYQILTRAGKDFDLGKRIQQATDLPIHFVDEADSDWNRLLQQQSNEFAPVIANPMAAINILFSSGTTGAPKAIPWNHTTPIKCALDGHLHQNLQPGDVVAWPTNLGWMMGPWLIFATLINKGTIAVYDDAPFGEGFGQFVQDARVNMLGLVPSMVRLWRSSQTMESFDWSHIKCFSSTGEASNAEDMFYLSWLSDFKPIIEYCGGTEIGGGYISSTVAQPNAPATFSTPAFGLDVKILAVDSNDSGDNDAEEGELFLVPPSLGLSTELLNRDHHETYFGGGPVDSDGVPLRRHGDYFRKLANGYYAAGGRADDTMNLGGIKVSSVEIEKVINQMAEVSESAAVAVPRDQTGPDQLVVFVVPTDGSTESLADESFLQKMNALIKENLNPLFKIGQIVAKDSLPRTASNKVMRRLLRDELLNQ